MLNLGGPLATTTSNVHGQMPCGGINSLNLVHGQPLAMQAMGVIGGGSLLPSGSNALLGATTSINAAFGRLNKPTTCAIPKLAASSSLMTPPYDKSSS